MCAEILEGTAFPCWNGCKERKDIRSSTTTRNMFCVSRLCVVRVPSSSEPGITLKPVHQGTSAGGGGRCVPPVAGIAPEEKEEKGCFLETNCQVLQAGEKVFALQAGYSVRYVGNDSPGAQAEGTSKESITFANVHSSSRHLGNANSFKCG